MSVRLLQLGWAAGALASMHALVAASALHAYLRHLLGARDAIGHGSFEIDTDLPLKIAGLVAFALVFSALAARRATRRGWERLRRRATHIDFSGDGGYRGMRTSAVRFADPGAARARARALVTTELAFTLAGALAAALVVAHAATTEVALHNCFGANPGTTWVLNDFRPLCPLALMVLVRLARVFPTPRVVYARIADLLP